VEKRDKRQLEGLLRARSEGIRHGRRPRRVRTVPTVVFERPLPPTETAPYASSARLCEGCGGEIGTRRLRALPRTTLCLDCQRSAEQAAAAT
jgi:hypothetical protein